MNELEYVGVNKCLSRPDFTPKDLDYLQKPESKTKIADNKKLEDENSDSSQTDDSPLPDKEEFLSKRFINKGIDYNYPLNYIEYPILFDYLPTKIIDDEDDSYLWQKPTEIIKTNVGILNPVENNESEQNEEELKRKQTEKDREPNFFVNNEGFRFARKSFFYFDETSFTRIFIINLVLYTKYYQRCLLFFLLLNLLAYGLYNFGYRLDHVNYREISVNEAAYNIEIICNIFFTVELFLKFISVGVIFESYTYLRTSEGVMNFIFCILNWLFLLDPDENFNIEVFNLIWFLKALRILRVFRLLFVFHDMRLTVVCLINAIPYMARTFYCLLIVFMFYTVWGLHFFSGIEEYRCRETPEPTIINGTMVWKSVGIDFHCGYWTCPEGSYCGSPYDYNMTFDNSELNIEFLNFGVTTFTTFFDSLLIVIHFIFLAGWSNHTYTIWRSSDGILTAFFFGSLVLIGFFIMVNLFLASVYDSFMLHTSIKDKSKQIQKETVEIKKEEESNFFLNLGNISKNKKINTAESQNEKKPKDMRMSVIPLKPKFTEYPGKSLFLASGKEFILNLFEKSWFRNLITLMIIGDIIVLSLDGYSISKANMILLHQFDFFFFCFFFLEISAKFISTGLDGLRKSFLFSIDFLVIYLNFAIYIYEILVGFNIFEEGSLAGAGIKTMKMIRIFKVLYYTEMFSSLSLLIRALIKTLNKMKQFFFIMLVMVVVFALIGIRLFSDRARFIDTSNGGLVYSMIGNPIRPNFDDFFNSLVSIMLVVYNEEWHISMYKHYLAVGPISLVYFIVVIFISNIIMMKLLVAVFLNNFLNYIKTDIIQEETGGVLKMFKLAFQKNLFNLSNYISNQENNEKVAKSKFDLFKLAISQRIINLSKIIHDDSIEKKPEDKTLKVPDNPIINAMNFQANKHFNEIINIPPHSDNYDRRLIKKSILSDISILKVPQIPLPIKRIDTLSNKFSNIKKKTLFLFPENNLIRKYLQKILSNWAFETFMLIVIFISSLILVIQSPHKDPNSFSENFLMNLDQTVTIIYGIEFIMNAIAFGFILGSDTYLRRSIWNILDFAVFIFSLLGSILTRSQININSMKVFRILRILKLGQRNPGIRVATQALMSALPNIIRMFIFSLILILCFALFGMRYLKGQYFYCTTLEKYILDNFVSTRFDCMDWGGDWVRHDMHFDSIFAAISTLFQIATSEGWLYEMYKAVDATDSDFQPHLNNNQYWMIFFLIYFFVGNFVVMSMFIAVIGETYLDQKNKASKFNLLTEQQKEWALIKSSIYKMKPKNMKSETKFKFQEKINRFRKWKLIKYIYSMSICFNIIILTLYYHRQPKEYRDLLDKINLSMIIIFTFYFMLRILCISSIKIFLTSKNTIVTLITITLSYASLSLNNNHRELNSLAKASQTFLAYHILKKFNVVQRLFHTVLFVLPSLSNIVSLMLLILYIYAIIGMDIFAYLRPQKTVNGYDVDFKTFPRAVFSLFRVMSAETWFTIVSDCVRERSPNFACHDVKDYDDYVLYGLNGCGSSFNYFFFYTYQLFFSLILVNLFIVNILVSYGEIFNAEQRAIDRFQLSKINVLWTHFDPLANGYINYKDFWTLASKIAVVFGVSEKDLLEVKNKKNFINILKIPLYENTKQKLFCYKFHDVIVRLAEISVTIKYGVVDLEPPNENPNDTETAKEEKSIVKVIKGKTEFSKTAFHSGHMASIMIIYNKIRKWVKKARKEKDEIVDIQGFHDFLKKKKENQEEEERKESQEEEKKIQTE